MGTQTGSYDFKAAKEAHDSAAQTSTKYITDFGDDGIKVHPEGERLNFNQIGASESSIYHDGVSVASYGEQARIGKLSSGHMVVSSDGLDYLQGDVSVFNVAPQGDKSYLIKESFYTATIAAGSYIQKSYLTGDITGAYASAYEINTVYKSGDVYVEPKYANTPGSNAVYATKNVVIATDDNGVKVGESVSIVVFNRTSEAIEFQIAGTVDARSVKVRIGKEYVEGATDNESHMELDYHSMQMFDKEGNKYLHVSDLRDSTGVASITDTYTGDGVTDRFALSTPSADVANIAVEVDGAISSAYTYTTVDGAAIVFNQSAIPASGETVEISYTTTSVTAKAYTFGLRDENMNIGALSVAEGDFTAAPGFAAHSEGMFTEAMASSAHAEGIMTEALGQAAHSEGSATVATMRADHAEGKSTTACGETYSPGSMGEMSTQDEIYAPAHAEGYETTGHGAGVHAEGIHTTALGAATHAGGYYSQAEGVGTFAHGLRVIAEGNYQAVFGMRNVADTNDEYALIIGNGTADADRSNAAVIDWLGNYIAQGWAGVIQMFAGSTPPAGWLLCDGSAVSRTTYATLYAAIGDTWGAGDGSTTFNLPDLRGRAPIGAGTGSGLTARTLGGTVGAESVTLTAAQSGLPAHTHSISRTTNVAVSDSGHTHGSGDDGSFLVNSETVARRTVASGSGATNHLYSAGATSRKTATASGKAALSVTQPVFAVGAVTGGAAAASSAHTNMQPSAVVNFIIHTGKTS